MQPVGGNRASPRGRLGPADGAAADVLEMADDRTQSRLLRSAALIYIFSTPLDLIRLPIGSPVTVTGAAFLVAWVAALLRRQVRIPTGAGPLVVLGALVMWSFTTVLWSYAPGVSTTTSATVAFLALSSIAVAGVFPGSVLLPAAALAAGSAIAGAAAIVSGPDETSVLIEQATFLGIDQNALAFHVALGLACALFVVLHVGQLRYRAAALVAILVQAVALIVIGSRTGIGSGLALAGAFAVLSLNSVRRALSMLLVLAAVVLGALWVYRSALVPQRVLVWLDNPIAMDYRANIIDAFRVTQSDWFARGVGAGADADYLETVASWHKNAHSAFWRIWIELGMVGLILWGLLLAGLAFRALRSPNRAFFALAAVPIALFFYTLGPLGSNALWVVFGLALGANAAVEIVEGGSSVRRSNRLHN